MGGISKTGRAALAVLAIGATSSEARAQQAAAGPQQLTLGGALALAKARAPQVHAAFAQIASAEAQVAHARAGHLPTLTATGTGSATALDGVTYYNGAAIPNSPPNSQSYAAQAAVSLTWTLYDFGRTSAAIDAANAGVKSAELSTRALEQRAMAEAAVAYYTLLTDDALVRSADEVRADREKELAVTHRLAVAGYRSPVDETRAQVSLEVAKLDVSLAEAARDNDGAQLAAALMLDPSTAFRLQVPATPSVDARAAMDGRAAVASRREVAAAQAAVDAAERNLDSAKHAHLPTLSTQGTAALTYTFTHGPPIPDSTSPTRYASGALVLTVPIFDPSVNANVRAAEASLQAAQATLEQTTLDARTQGSQAARAVTNAQAVLDQSQRLAAGAAANLTVVEDRYANGLDGPLVLADAQREDALARVAVVKARLAYDVAKVRLLAGLSRIEELTKSGR